MALITADTWLPSYSESLWTELLVMAATTSWRPMSTTTSAITPPILMAVARRHISPSAARSADPPWMIATNMYLYQ